MGPPVAVCAGAVHQQTQIRSMQQDWLAERPLKTYLSSILGDYRLSSGTKSGQDYPKRLKVTYSTTKKSSL